MAATGEPARTGTARSSVCPAWCTYRQAIVLVCRGVTLRVAGKVALIVGTILSATYQAAVILDGHAGWVTWLRVAVNYATPFTVASVGFLAAARSRDQP